MAFRRGGRAGARVVRKLKENAAPHGAASIPDELSSRLPHMVPVVVVVPAVNGPGVRAPPVVPPARFGWRRYKARQHCEGSEKYGKTPDIKSHGLLLIAYWTGADLRPLEQDARERRGFRRRSEAKQRRSVLALLDQPAFAAGAAVLETTAAPHTCSTRTSGPSLTIFPSWVC